MSHFHTGEFFNLLTISSAVEVLNEFILGLAHNYWGYNARVVDIAPKSNNNYYLIMLLKPFLSSL